MFSDDEIEQYRPLFSSIGIEDEQMQEKMLEFFYTFGAMCFDKF